MAGGQPAVMAFWIAAILLLLLAMRTNLPPLRLRLMVYALCVVALGVLITIP